MARASRRSRRRPLTAIRFGTREVGLDTIDAGQELGDAVIAQTRAFVLQILQNVTSDFIIGESAVRARSMSARPVVNICRTCKSVECNVARLNAVMRAKTPHTPRTFRTNTFRSDTAFQVFPRTP